MSDTRSPSGPRFSVVIPLYNKGRWIRPTLETVLAQRLAPHEVIVVDDGSTDGGPEAIADLIAGPVRLIRQANAGPGPARNHGAALASGDWIALIDADDRWHPDHLHCLAAAIAAVPEADLVASDTRWLSVSAIDLDLPAIADPRPRPLDFFADTSLGDLHTSSVAIRREAWLAGEGFGAFIPGEDVEFWIRFALDHPVARIPVPTSIYVRGNDGIMENDAAPFIRRGTTERQPFERTLEQALADEGYRSRWRSIADYADRAVMIAARNMLYVGNGSGARGELARLRGPAGATARAYFAASFLPGGVLRRAARLYGTLKAGRARAS